MSISAQAGKGEFGDAVVRGKFRGDEVVITTTARLAGAIDSIKWKGKEFINSFDHGRQLQSAAQFDGAGASYNPTEAGSKNDGVGPETTSKLRSMRREGNSISTQTQMAFWLGPGDKPVHCPAGVGVRVPAALSDYILRKTVSLGYGGLGNVIEHRVVFSLPRSHHIGVFEVITAYMPPDFLEFWTFDPQSFTLSKLSDGPGEQSLPIIFSTRDLAFAMGVIGEGLPLAEWPLVGYGRSSFGYLMGDGAATVKWNCVFRLRDIDLGDHGFRCFSIFGSLEDVAMAMKRLRQCAFKVAC